MSIEHVDDLRGMLDYEVMAVIDALRADLAAGAARIGELEEVAGLGYWTLKVKAKEGDEDAIEIVRLMEKIIPPVRVLERPVRSEGGHD